MIRGDFFFLKMCFRTLKPARFEKKIPFGRIILPFFFESSESDRVFNYLHDSNSIFRVGRINSEIFSARTVSPSKSKQRVSSEERRTPARSQAVQKSHRSVNVALETLCGGLVLRSGHQELPEPCARSCASLVCDREGLCGWWTLVGHGL